MRECLGLGLIVAVGGLLGVFFYGGLRWTVHRGVASSVPALWFFGSLLVRVAVTLAGFFVISAGHWERLLACLFGFSVARMIVTRVPLPTADGLPEAAAGADHAP